MREIFCYNARWEPHRGCNKIEHTSTNSLNLSSLMPICWMGSSSAIPLGNRFWTSSTLFQRCSRAMSCRKSLGTTSRRWLILSIVESRTGTITGWPFWSAGQGLIPVGWVEIFEWSEEGVLPLATLRRTLTIYCSWGGTSASGIGRF